MGRFLSVDPLTRSYPMLTSYQFASNRPIDGIDLDGLEWEEVKDAFTWGADQTKKMLVGTAEGVKLLATNPSEAIHNIWESTKATATDISVMGETGGSILYYTFIDKEIEIDTDAFHEAAHRNAKRIAGTAAMSVITVGASTVTRGSVAGVKKVKSRNNVGAGDGNKRIFDAGGMKLQSVEPTGVVLGQSTTYTCVSCATQIALKDLGIVMAELDIAEALGTTTGGANIMNIPSAIQKLGVKANAIYKRMTFDELTAHVQAGNSPIVSVNVPGKGPHAVIVDKISDGTVTLRDPLPLKEGSAYSVSDKDFSRYYSQKTVTITQKQ